MVLCACGVPSLGVERGKSSFSLVGSRSIVVASLRWWVSLSLSKAILSSSATPVSSGSDTLWVVLGVSGFHSGLVFFIGVAARWVHSNGWEHLFIPLTVLHF